MFEYNKETKEIVHSTYITREYVLNVYDTFAKDTDKELSDEEIASLINWVVCDLNTYEDKDDFSTDECIDQSVREWIEEKCHEDSGKPA